MARTRGHISLIVITCAFYTCYTQNIRQLKRKVDIIEAKQELESKLRKAAIETMYERIDDLEEKIANITELADDTEEDSFERKNRKSDSNRVKMLSKDIKSLKDDFSRLFRAFSVEKKQNIQNKLELTELNARVSREQSKNEVSDVVNSILKKEIAKLEQQVYLNITEQLREKIKENADMKEESHYEKVETSEREVADYQHGSCSELLEKGGKTENGIYTIYPLGGKKSGIRVYCDQTTDGGGWTVFQRRKDGSENFYRNWNEYKVGFGFLDGEFWLGNDYLSVLTSSGNNELRINLEGWENERCYAEYSGFRIGPETENYSLHFSKFLQSTCGDALTYHNGMSFSTKDRDNDNKSSYNCAERFTGGWWFDACLHSGLNGVYNKKSAGGVYWYHWKQSFTYSCKFSEMKFR